MYFENFPHSLVSILLFSSILAQSFSENLEIDNERKTYADLMLSYMNTNIDPCDDFYEYACGNYFKVHQGKGSRSFGAFELLNENIKDDVHRMLMEPVADDEHAPSVEDRARYFYQSCMREQDLFEYRKSEEFLNIIRDELGGWPALDEAWDPKNFNWFDLVIAMKRYGVNAIIEENMYNKEFPQISVIKASFGLKPMGYEIYRPLTKEYYLNKQLAKKVMIMYGVPEAKAERIFKEIMIFGKNFYNLVRKSIRSEGDFEENLNKMDIDERAKLMIYAMAAEMFEDFKNTHNETDFYTYYSLLYDEDHLENVAIVSDSSNFAKLPYIFRGKNTKRAANYMMIKFLYELHSEMRAKKDLKSFCLSRVNKFMSDVVTAMFLQSKYYDKSKEHEILAMMTYIQSALKDAITAADWMDDETKKKALKKLRLAKIEIANSQYVLDLDEMQNEGLGIEKNTSFRANEITLLHQTAKRKIVKEFVFKNQLMVNAAYIPSENKLIIPAGIFQKPFYYPELPKGYNFGNIGFILAHEFSHAFDSTGKDYDEYGKEGKWWSEEAEEKYNNRTECFIQQYSGYRVSEMMQNVKGEKTLEENIADNGAIRYAFYGYKKWLHANEGSINMDREVLPGLNLTNDQLLFLSFGQTLCMDIRDPKVFSERLKDVHTIRKLRLPGSLSNFEEFSKAFNCEPGSKMNRENKCILF